MLGNRRMPAGAVAALAASFLVWPLAPAAQRTSPEIDVRHYLIEAEINPDTQDLTAKVAVEFTAVDDGVRSATFGFHNDLRLDRVTDSQQTELNTSRSLDDFTVRVTFPEPLPKDKTGTITFSYHGRLTGREDSPVWGINFAAIHQDYAYLLYPARWFPVHGYTTDRYTAEMKITVPAEYKVVASGIATSETTPTGKVTYDFNFSQPSFPGSIAVVQGEPAVVSSEGVQTTLYFRGDAAGMANAYGDEIGRLMTHFTGVYGLPPQSGLTVVETGKGTPNGYAAPGLLFLSPSAIGNEVDSRLLVNQISRQWWGVLVSPATRNHLWLTNGAARYSEVLWLAETKGPAAVIPEMKDDYIEALTVDKVPLIQSSRLEDYSPEYWAATAAKGAAVLHMLRQIVGDDAFGTILKNFLEQYAWKSFYTDDFRHVAESVSGKNLQAFFVQWIESSGAPEFDMDYTVYRTRQGFRIMGKITQDLDTFRMPVTLKILTEGNPEEKQVEVVGPSTEFVVETFGKPKEVIIDPDNKVLRYDDKIRVAVAIRRGEQFAEIGEFLDALREYQKALDVNRYSSLAHYRVAEVFFLQRNYQSAANEFREALNGDLEPKWTEVWSHINLGKIFDITGQRERAVNEYNLALRTKDNTQGALEQASLYLQKPYERPRENI